MAINTKSPLFQIFVLSVILLGLLVAFLLTNGKGLLDIRRGATETAEYTLKEWTFDSGSTEKWKEDNIKKLNAKDGLLTGVVNKDGKIASISNNKLFTTLSKDGNNYLKLNLRITPNLAHPQPVPEKYVFGVMYNGGNEMPFDVYPDGKFHEYARLLPEKGAVIKSLAINFNQLPKDNSFQIDWIKLVYKPDIVIDDPTPYPKTPPPL